MSHETPSNKNPILTVRIVTPVVIVSICVLTAVIGLLYFSGALSSPEQRVAEIVANNPTFNIQNTAPKADAAALAATQEALLQGYAWVDQGAGVARIPIDRAMVLIVATEEARQTEASPSTAAQTLTVTPAPGATGESVENGESSAGVARPSNPGGAGQAVKLSGDAQSGAQVFVANCQVCHGINGQGGVANPGSDDETIPSLNPIDDTLISSDPATYAYNLDLFLEHGSKPEGTNPQQSMPAFGDEGRLAPQQIADAVAYVMSLNPAPPSAAAATVTVTPAPGATGESVESGESSMGVARPSNPGGAGQAVKLSGDAQSGAQVFVANCQVCHGINGQGGVANPGSDDETIPSLNPIDDTLISSDPATYAYNLDLFLEHGSKPEGTNPQQSMPAFGDEGRLAPQQIADAVAYVMSLNPAP